MLGALQLQRNKIRGRGRSFYPKHRFAFGSIIPLEDQARANTAGKEGGFWLGVLGRLSPGKLALS